MQRMWMMLPGLLAVFVAACGGEATSGPASPTGASIGDPSPTVDPASSDSRESATVDPSPTATPGESDPGARFAADWPETDFTGATINLDEVRSGGVPRDGIPPLDAEGTTSIESSQAGAATFVPLEEVDYEPQMPVMVVSREGETKGYPIHILTWHEVVNDLVGDLPVAVTFCPLCNTAIVFDRTVEGERLDFGVSGMLRNSDLIMWDRQTESWWQQATGEAIAGDYAGTNLEPVTATTIPFGEFASRHPDALVLSEDTGQGRSYGTNPYAGYDSSPSPMLFDGETDDRLPPMERVLALPGDEPVSVPYSFLHDDRVANVERAEGPAVVFWAPGQVTALGDSSIADAEDVGTAVAFDPRVDDERLTFSSVAPGRFLDDQTGTEWDMAGMAVDGPLQGTQLATVNHMVPFWFAWAAFHPDTILWGG